MQQAVSEKRSLFRERENDHERYGETNKESKMFVAIATENE